jgi:hypothetical protein
MTWSEALGPKRGAKTRRSVKVLVEELKDLYCFAKYRLGIKEGVVGRTCSMHKVRET